MFCQRFFVYQAIGMRPRIVLGSLVARVPLGAVVTIVALSLLSTTEIIAADGTDNHLLVKKVISQTCTNCHNNETAKGDLNLSQVPWKLDDNEVRQLRVL